MDIIIFVIMISCIIAFILAVILYKNNIQNLHIIEYLYANGILVLIASMYNLKYLIAFQTFSRHMYAIEIRMEICMIIAMLFGIINIITGLLLKNKYNLGIK